MNDSKQGHHFHGGSETHSFQDGRPYWKRAHRDWRVWVAVCFIFVAIFIYVMSEDFGSLSGSRLQTSPQGAVRK